MHAFHPRLWSPLCLAVVAIPWLEDRTCRSQTTHEITLVARPSAVEIEPGRTVHNAWLYDGKLPGPTIRVTEGDTLRVTVVNELPEVTTVHWHGLPVPLRVDGVPGVSQGPIGVGQRYTYEFVADVSGTYWYHPHLDLQIDRGLVAPLIVDPRDPTDDPPFDREYIVVLDDWLPGAPVAGRDPIYIDYLLNGRTSLGQTPMVVRRDDVVRLRFVNVSGATNYVVTVDGHPMRVTHTDGRPVVPVVTRAIPIGVGERYDVYVTADNPGKWSVAVADLRDRSRTLVRGILGYEGSTGANPPPDYVPPDLRAAPLLRYDQLASARPIGPITPVPDRTYAIDLRWGGMMSYVWTINGQAFPNASPINVGLGDAVRFQTSNFTMVAHPMHIHGHFFKLLGSAGGIAAPLVKDTVLVPRGAMHHGGGRLDMEFVADNPGNWAYHCHMIYHMAAGMMRLVRYVGTDDDRDGLADGQDFDPMHGRPVSWSADPTGYRPGSTVAVVAQWLPGTTLFWFVGPERTTPIDLGALGLLEIDLVVALGSVVVGADRTASLLLAIPADPGLSGVSVGLQAIGTHPTLPPGFRLSTSTLLTVR